MGMITCGDCGRPVSDRELSCPYCGYPVNMSINKMLKEQKALKNSSKSSGKNNIKRSSDKHRTSHRHDASRMHTNSNQNGYNTPRKNTNPYNHKMDTYQSLQSQADRYGSGNTRTVNVSKTVIQNKKKAKKKKQHSNLPALIIIAVLLVAIILLFMYGVSSCNAKSITYASPVEDENGITYYSNKDDGGKLYKKDENSPDAQPVKLSEFCPSEILLNNDWIYYVNNDRDSKIFRVSKQGLDETMVFDRAARNLEIAEGYLLFEDVKANYAPYRILLSDIDGKNLPEAVPDDGSFTANTSNTVSNTGSSISDSASGTDNNSSSVSQDNSDNGSFTPSIKVKNSKLPWNLVLANKYHAIDISYDEEITLSMLENGKKFDKRAKNKMNDMLKAMRTELSNCNIEPSSTYLSVATQTTYYEREVQKLVDSGIDQQEAEIQAAAQVAPPGTSDHNTGLAADFNDASLSFSDTQEYTWLKNNAHKYGFIERYPKDKVTQTGCEWQPYHFRYVGEEAAAVIKEKNLCLEEYIFETYPNAVVKEDE